jgi:hypothetical protein
MPATFFFDFKLGPFGKTPQAFLARARALLAPSIRVSSGHQTPKPDSHSREG